MLLNCSKAQAVKTVPRARLGPYGWAALVAVPTILLIALLATSPTTLCSTWRLGRFVAVDQELGQAGVPFVPPPAAVVMEQYVNCILNPAIKAANESATCPDFNVPRPYPPKLRRMNSQPVVLVNHSRCAATSGFRAGDERELMYEAAAAYARPGTSDGYAWIQVFCLEFDYLKLLVPYIPRSRPIAMLDAGANAGFASFLFARLMRFQGELVSVEMNPLSARMVRRNTMVLNGVPGMRSRVVNAALVSAGEEVETPVVRFMGAADGHFLANRLTTVKEYAGSKYTMRVPATSLPSLLEMVEAPAFDFIKLDIEGAELSILRDPASRRVLCKARCVFAELHERYMAGIEAAWANFVESGCPEGRRMRELTNTGEYSIVCREDLDL